MVASRISILLLSLKYDFPKRSLFIKFDKLNLDIWGSILFRLFMSVHLLSRNKRRRLYIWSSMLVLTKCFAAYEVLLLYWFYLERYVKDRSMLISNQE